MSDVQDQTTTIPWWQSVVIRRLALSIAVQVLSVTHLSQYVTGASLSLLVDDLLEVAGIAYAAFALHARATRPTPPVATSQKTADIANAQNDTPAPPPEKPA